MPLVHQAYAAAQARGTRYERLLLSAWLAEANQSPAVLTLADSLLAAFPYEPEAYVLAGSAHGAAADFPGMIRIYRQLAALDSQALQTGGPWCRACLALEGMAAGYQAMDSLEQSMDAIRRGARAQPRNKGFWQAEVFLLSARGRMDDALGLIESRADSVDVTAGEVAAARAWVALRGGDWASVDRAVTALTALSGESHHAALWIQVISERTRGRLARAALAARQYERSEGPIPRGIVLFESGAVRAAAALWDSLRLTWDVRDTASGYEARQSAWMLAHEVTALAAAGDTARVVALIDTLERVGRWSSYARDRRMHHYARGLVWDARGRPAEAVAEYRQAPTSLLFGYTRINYRLAQDLIALGRPAEAIATLQPALRGGLEASNLYITHTELHELLAQAFEAAGRRDSAAAHYRWVAIAWRDADPSFRARGRLAADRAAILAR
jgi:tetratricopeptide (TPR) repeat protein